MTTHILTLPQRCETQYVPLAVLGYCLTHSDFLGPLTGVELKIKTVAHAPVQKLQDVLVSILANCSSIKQVDLRIFLGGAPILPYPLCFLTAMLTAAAAEGHIKYPVLEYIFMAIAFFYPVVPLACFVISFIAHRQGYARLAYATAITPLVFYVFSCIIYFFMLTPR